MRTKFILSETWHGLRRNLTMTTAMVVTVAISLTLLGAALVINSQVERMKGYWYDRVEVSVFLCGDTPEGVENPRCPTGAITATQRETVEEDIRALPDVKEVYYESQEEAFGHFSEQFKDSPQLLENVDADALPESYRVSLNNPEAFETVAAAIAPSTGVEEVVDQKQVLERFFAVMNGFQTGALVLAVLQIVVAAILISNTVRVAAYSRRNEIGIMRLVGAPNWSIRLPFLLEGVLAGLAGSIISAGALFLVKHLLIDQRLAVEATAIPFIGWGTMWMLVPVLVVVGLGLSGVASFLTLRRHLQV